MTIREEANEQVKQQIRTLAETLCKMIDDWEFLLKRQEQTTMQLAEQIDSERVIG